MARQIHDMMAGAELRNRPWLCQAGAGECRTLKAPASSDPASATSPPRPLHGPPTLRAALSCCENMSGQQSRRYSRSSIHACGSDEPAPFLKDPRGDSRLPHAGVRQCLTCMPAAGAVPNCASSEEARRGLNCRWVLSIVLTPAITAAAAALGRHKDRPRHVRSVP